MRVSSGLGSGMAGRAGIFLWPRDIGLWIPICFFEVYDPWGYHEVYADGTPKSRNRHLLAGELTNAITNWWNYLIVIPPRGGEGAGAAANIWLQPVDPKTIVHMWGR